MQDVSVAIEDRIPEHTGDVDYLDRIMGRRIAIELHIVSKASGYVENGVRVENLCRLPDCELRRDSPGVWLASLAIPGCDSSGSNPFGSIFTAHFVRRKSAASRIVNYA